MLPLAVTLVVAALLGLSFFIHPIWLWFNVAPEKLSNDPERENFFQYFSTDPEFFAFSDATTSDWLLGEAKSLCAQKIDAIKAYEAKATTQFSIVGSGIGVLTVVGGADLHQVERLPDSCLSGLRPVLTPACLDTPVSPHSL